jgi:hypothetical protein
VVSKTTTSTRPTRRGPDDEPNGHDLNDAGFDHPPESPVVAADSKSLPNCEMELSVFKEEWDVAQVPNVHADYAAAAFLQDPAAPEQQSTLPPQEEGAWTAASLSFPPPPVTEFQAAPKDPSSTDRSTGSSNLTHVSLLDDDGFRMACYDPQPINFFDLNKSNDIASWIH